LVEPLVYFGEPLLYFSELLLHFGELLFNFVEPLVYVEETLRDQLLERHLVSFHFVFSFTPNGTNGNAGLAAGLPRPFSPAGP
jgi:hypothetical protein